MDNFFNAQTLLSFFGILAALVALGVLVAVHEAGHLLMAKMCGIRVDIFSVGMGRAVWSKQFGETSYQIGWIPFGGYCAFGEEGEDTKADPRSIVNAPYWAQAVTIIGGSLFNMVFAFLAFLVVFNAGYKEFRLSNVVQVNPAIIQGEKEIPSPAWEAGLRSGDKVIALSDIPVNYFNDITIALATENKNQPTVSYVRGETTNTVPFTPIVNRDSGVGILGVSPVRVPKISEVFEDYPAARSGLRVGDTITSIKGQKISYAFEAELAVANRQETEDLKLTVLRGADLLDFELTPEYIDDAWRAGIVFAPPQPETVIVKAKSFGQSISLSLSDLGKLSGQMLASLQKIFTGKINVQKNLSGPVRIVSITSEIAQTLDFMYFLRFGIMLSVALAVFNMLPIPGLDGGGLVLNGVRALTKRSPFAAQAESVVSFIERAGLIFLLLIAAFVFYNDIINLRAERKAQAVQVQKNP